MSRNQYRLASIFFVFLFVLSFVLISNPIIHSLDLSLSHAIQSARHPILLLLMKIISWIGDSPFVEILVIIVSVLLYRSKNIREGSLILASSFASMLVAKVIKNLVARPRPLSDEVVQYTFPDGFSFPSSHTYLYTVFFGLILFLIINRESKYKFLKKILIILISLIGFSRVYLGAHWFTDVIAGYSLGFATLFLILSFNRPKN